MPRHALRSRVGADSDGGLSDFAIRGAGVALAFCACAFAYGELGSSGAPKINGMDHLALFAQPHRLRDDRLRQEAERRPGLDYAPTATIGKDAGGHSIWRVERDLVVFRGPEGLFAVHIGDEAPGHGRLVSIDRRDGAWRPTFAKARGQTSR